MDFFNTYRYRMTLKALFSLLAMMLITLGVAWALVSYNTTDPIALVSAISAVWLTGIVIVGSWLGRACTAPLEAVWQAIQHIAPEGENVAAPNLKKLTDGREVVSIITSHMYQLASVVDGVESTTSKKTQDIHTSFVANALPLPLLVLDKSDAIVFANDPARAYFNTTTDDLTGTNIYTSLDMSFENSQTLHAWLKKARSSSATSNERWERVRVGLVGQKDTKLFDLAAHYNRENPLGYEVMLVLFDHTEVYSQDDQAMSFVALTVHELRTPLTLLRGYIEVFDEEIGPQLDDDMKDFMKKMDVAAEQLSAFVDNILNVAKIEDNQLSLQLHKENWADVVAAVAKDMQLRAGVRGITIETTIAPNLPPVAVDRYSIYEVIANLLDNAIKYSRQSKKVEIEAHVNDEGLVETTVKDYGVGIDTSILPHIFDKFYRNHRNRAQIGGTGLGLFLSRAIVQAHEGQITVRSKPTRAVVLRLPYSLLTPSWSMQRTKTPPQKTSPEMPTAG